MSDETELDVEELRSELDQIKDAMGIHQRYEGATSQWLLFGVLVPVAAGLSQYVLLAQLPLYYHSLIWAGVLGGGAAVGTRLFVEYETRSTGDNKPTLFVQFGAVFGSFYLLLAIMNAYTPELGYTARTASGLAMSLVLLGVAYIVMGNSLRAYYIRKRDRYALYVGGLLMAALGVAIPFSPTLEIWGYAVFGGTYFGYAMTTYAVLTR